MGEAYAQALWELIARGMDREKAFRGMREALERRGRMELIPHISRAFKRIAQRQLRRQAVVLAVAREHDESKAKKEVHALCQELSIEPRELTVVVDPTLVGGWRLEGRESLVDASYKKYLLDMYERAVK